MLRKAAALLVHDPSDNLVPQPQTFTRRGRRLRAAAVLRRAIVTDLQPRPARVASPLNADGRAARRVLQGVVDQVAQGQLQQQRMRLDLQPFDTLHTERVPTFPRRLGVALARVPIRCGCCGPKPEAG